MKIGWVGGWGFGLEEMQAIAVSHSSNAEHLIYPPVMGAAENLIDCDFIVGWSLGAHLILEAASRGVKLPSKTLLIAPFTSFCAEHGRCGKVSEVQVRWLDRWLKTNPHEALSDFRKRAGLAPLITSSEPYELKNLSQGLEILAQPAGLSMISFCRQGLPIGWEAYVGADDYLLNGDGVCQAIVGCQIIEGLGHNLSDFLTDHSFP